MRFEARVFKLAKDAQAPADFQDAAGLDAERGVAALADGVSSALFSGPWASILTAAVVADPPDPADPEAFARWLAQRRTRWSQQIDASNLPWFQRVKIKQGAFSTLLWVELLPASAAEGPSAAYEFRAYAVGDSCLFHTRHGDLAQSFPLRHSAELDADPLALGSIDLNHDEQVQFATLTGWCWPGDLLALCTDAVAGWALQAYEAGQAPAWDRIWDLSEEQWQAEVEQLRATRQMRFDDATLLLLRVCPERVETPADTFLPQANEKPAERAPVEIPPPVTAAVVEPATSPPPAAPGPPPHPGPGAKDSPPHDSDAWRWAESLAATTEQLAEQVSDEMRKGMRQLKDKFWQKYRDTFTPKDRNQDK